MQKVYLAFFGTLTVLIGLILSIGFLSIFPQFSPQESEKTPTSDDPSLINGDETNSAVRNASEEDYPIPYYGLDDPIPYSEHTLSSGLMCGTSAGEPYFTGVGTYCNGRNAENYSTYRLSIGSSPGIGGRPGSIDMRGWPLPNPYADGGAPVIVQDFKTHGSYGIDLSLSGQPFDFVPVYATITGETIDGSDSLDRNKPNADFHPYGSFMRMRNAKWIVVNAQRSWLNRRLTAGSSAGTFTTDPDAPDVRPFGRAEYDGKTIYGCNKSCEIGREVCESCATDDDPDCMECDWVDVDVIEADCDSEIMDQALAAAPDKQVIPGQGLGSIASNCTMYKPYEACVMQHGEFVTYEPLGEDFLGGTFITKVENYETVTAHLTYSSIRNSPEPLLAVEEGGIASYPIKHLEGWQMGNMGTSGNPASTNINDLINSPSESYTRLPMIHYEVWKNAMGNPFQNDHRCHEYIQLQPVDPASFFDQPAEDPPSSLFPACDQTWDVDGAPVGTSASTLNCRYLWNQDNTTWQQTGVADCRPEPGPQFDWMYHRGGRSAYDYTGIQAGARVAQKLAEKVANVISPPATGGLPAKPISPVNAPPPGENIWVYGTALGTDATFSGTITDAAGVESHPLIFSTLNQGKWITTIIRYASRVGTKLTINVPVTPDYAELWTPTDTLATTISGNAISFHLPTGPGLYVLKTSGRKPTETITIWVDDYNAVAQVAPVGSTEITTTGNIQSAIDAALPGAVLYIGPGIHKADTIRIKDKNNLTFVFHPEAILYQNISRSNFIQIDRSDNIHFFSPGEIVTPKGNKSTVIQARNSTNLTFNDVFIYKQHRDDGWTLHLYESNELQVNNVRIISGNDATDPDSSSNVTYNGVYLEGWDDALALKTRGSKPAINVRFTNGFAKSRASGLKIGKATIRQKVDNIYFENSTVFDTDRSLVIDPSEGGASIGNVYFTNIRVKTVEAHKGFGRSIRIIGNAASYTEKKTRIVFDGLEAHMIEPHEILLGPVYIQNSTFNVESGVGLFEQGERKYCDKMHLSNITVNWLGKKGSQRCGL